MAYLQRRVVRDQVSVRLRPRTFATDRFILRREGNSMKQSSKSRGLDAEPKAGRRDRAEEVINQFKETLGRAALRHCTFLPLIYSSTRFCRFNQRDSGACFASPPAVFREREPKKEVRSSTFSWNCSR